MESMLGSQGRTGKPLLVCSPSHYLWKIVPYCIFSSDLSILLLKVPGPRFLPHPLRDWSNVSSCQEFWSVFFLPLKTLFFFPFFFFLYPVTLCYIILNEITVWTCFIMNSWAFLLQHIFRALFVFAASKSGF